MKFEEEKIKSNCWTYRNYLEKRCMHLADSLEKEIQKISEDSFVTFENSDSFGMSNYIEVNLDDDERNIHENIAIRISDHSPTGSGDPCDFYIYIQNKEWREIKEQVQNIVGDFVTSVTGEKYMLKQEKNPESQKAPSQKNVLDQKKNIGNIKIR